MSEILLSPGEQAYLQQIEDMNKARGDGLEAGFTERLHKQQIKVLKSVYKEKKKLIFVPCGRKFGKTEIACYILWHHALNNPGSACYFIGPENSHIREFVWNLKRLQNFLGPDSKKYLADNPTREDQMRLNFRNGSYIRCMGSENWAAGNGLTPSIAVYDEFKVFNSKWHIEFDPNRAAKAAPLIIIGTMPKVGDSNKEQYESLLEYAKATPKTCAVHTFTTWDNPINLLPDRKEAIEEQIKILRARGEEDVVQREYYSKIVPGGSRAIFPMLQKDKHIFPAYNLHKEVQKDSSKMEWFCVVDPGTTTCFAALIGCINPYTKRIYILDEIYEKDQNMTSVRMMYPRVEKLMRMYYPSGSIHDDWIKVFDEAAAWFSNEVMQQYGVYFSPTEKHLNKKEAGLSIIKDVLIHDLVKISANCENLFKEMQEYAKDDKGNIPKRNDHLIDCFRYLLAANNYSMLEALEVVKTKHPEELLDRRRVYHLLDEEVEGNKEDWTNINFFDDYDW